MNGAEGRLRRSRAERPWAYTYDPDGRVLTVTGPDPARGIDGYTYDELGRPKTVRSADMRAESFYDDAGRLERIEHQDGAGNLRSKAVRTYDAADRLLTIEHRDAADVLLLRVSYAWNRDNTVHSRTEYDATVAPPRTAVVTFGYDDRKRLVTEDRIVGGSEVVYDREYFYDQLGNRKRQEDHLLDRVTCYLHDTDWDPEANGGAGDWVPGLCFTPAEPLAYWTRNNRLLEYREYGPQQELERTVRYTYYDTGHVGHITVKDEWTGGGNPPPEYEKYYDLELVYATNETLWLAIWQEWAPLPGGGFPDVPDAVRDAWEFRYDSGRERYLARRWEVEFQEPPLWPLWTPAAGGTMWTEYLGEQPYGDFDVQVVDEQPEAHEQVRYLAGLGAHAQQMLDGQGDPIRYLHGDLVRSTMLLTPDYSPAS